MDISIICFSLTGFQTALKLQEGLNAQGYHTKLYKKSKYLEILLRKVQETGQQSISRRMTG